ncbi:MAG: hypothetical protein HYV40_03545 [Candidatus Levybacteria bacterium]|nr:hypothetical protein [Candidatus Levybacteria bacterium]
MPRTDFEPIRWTEGNASQWGPGGRVHVVRDMEPEDLNSLGAEVAVLTEQASHKAASWSGSVPKIGAYDVWIEQTVFELSGRTPTIAPTAVHLEKMMEVPTSTGNRNAESASQQGTANHIQPIA